MAGMKHDADDLAASGDLLAASWPASNQQAESLLRLIHWSGAAGRQLRRRLAEVAAAFDLTDTELLVVWLCSAGACVQIELAGAIGVSPSQMSGLAERLRSRGLVAMHRPALDRRRQMWVTTASGQVLLDRIAGRLETIAAEIADVLSHEEQRMAQAFCQRLAEAVAISQKRPTTKAPATASGSSKEAA
jgi:DNA-binding MarR family transcriptional regulator